MTASLKYTADIEQLMGGINAHQYNNRPLSVTFCTGLSEDSRKINRGDICIARPGLESDGRRFIHQAAASGAVAILCEGTEIESYAQVRNCKVKIYQIKNIAEKLGQFSDIFYRHPSQYLTIVGVTGTNGKTSCSQLIARVAEKLKQKVAVIGSMDNGQSDNLVECNKATIEAQTLHKKLANYYQNHIELVSMEVSSHALKQGRVNAVNFDIALFTNLGCKHLDYHGDMKSYAKAKKMLLVKERLKAVVINADDTIGANLIADDDIKAAKYSYSITPVNARGADNSVWTESVVFHDTGIEAEIATPWGSVNFKTSMIGQFNLSNCLAVITTLGVLGFNLKNITGQLAKIPFVKGCMEPFGGENKPLVIVDYAHTVDALKHVLQAIKPHTNHKLWVVFGCDGDRDRGKRSEMAAIAEELADHLVFTSDNPRTEPVEDIISEMLKGLHRSSVCEVEYDREAAIRNTISKAVLGDVILVAGKGHEKFQIVGRKKFPHNDVEIVEQALSQGGWK